MQLRSVLALPVALFAIHDQPYAAPLQSASVTYRSAALPTCGMVRALVQISESFLPAMYSRSIPNVPGIEPEPTEERVF